MQAHDTITNAEKRKAYDSQNGFDDTIPSGTEKGDFYEIYGPVFHSNGASLVLWHPPHTTAAAARRHGDARSSRVPLTFLSRFSHVPLTAEPLPTPVELPLWATEGPRLKCPPRSYPLYDSPSQAALL